LSQGVPFFHAGDDILRSKSLDNNSYDSGDWFNKLDWTYTTDNWGAGLPAQPTDRWDIFRPLLANPALKPTHDDIANASAVFREFLQIRKSSPLFRLQTANQVKRSLTFPNVGPDQIPGLIVMQLQNIDRLDPVYGEIVVFFNGGTDPVTFGDNNWAGKKFSLHPVQQNSVDAVVRSASFEASTGTFKIPGRTTAVFVMENPPEPTPLPTIAATATAIVIPSATALPLTEKTSSLPASAILGIILAGVIVLALIIYFARKSLSK